MDKKAFNPQASPVILPPHDTDRPTDFNEVVLGARALINAVLSDSSAARSFLATVNEQVIKPGNDDLLRVEVLEGEGLDTDEAWDALDEIKRNAGIAPRK